MDIWSTRLVGAHLLDLYAGSGAVGIEALSRGASTVTFVESDPRSVHGLQATCRDLDLPEARVVRATLPAALSEADERIGGPFDLVFADPPYEFDRYSELLEATTPFLEHSGEIALEHAFRRQVPDRCIGLERADVRRYGDTCLSFFRPAAP